MRIKIVGTRISNISKIIDILVFFLITPVAGITISSLLVLSDLTSGREISSDNKTLLFWFVIACLIFSVFITLYKIFFIDLFGYYVFEELSLYPVFHNRSILFKTGRTYQFNECVAILKDQQNDVALIFKPKPGESQSFKIVKFRAVNELEFDSIVKNVSLSAPSSLVIKIIDSRIKYLHIKHREKFANLGIR